MLRNVFSIGGRRADPIRLIVVNFWTNAPRRFERLVEQLGFEITFVNPAAARTVLSMEPPDVLVVGFGAGSGTAAGFITDYKACSWFRRVPLVAVIESRDTALLVLCMRWGCDDAILKPHHAEHLRSRIQAWALRFRAREAERAANDKVLQDKRRAEDFGKIIVPLGVAMMAEGDFNVLLEMILAEARRFCNADGGTLYLLENDGALSFQLVANDSLNIRYGGTSGNPVPFRPLRVAESSDGTKPPAHIATHVLVSGETINVDDAYEQHRWDFSGTRAFDKATGYRTQSVLTIPLRDANRNIVGVLQLLNATDPASGSVIPFDAVSQVLMESLAVLAGQALASYRKMHQLKLRAEAVTIDIDEEEKRRQVSEIVKSEYFQKLRARASALRTESKQKVAHPVL